MVVVARFSFPHEAHIAKASLKPLELKAILLTNIPLTPSGSIQMLLAEFV